MISCFDYLPNVQVLNKYARPFKPAKPGDVGHDLFVSMFSTKRTWLDKLVSKVLRENVAVVWPGMTKLLSSGIQLNMPNDVWCQIVARSSTGRKRLMVLGGMIDSGYQGELFTVLANFSFIPRVVRNGERYSQAIFYPAVRPALTTVSAFTTQSVRGDTGFGSSGQ